MAKDPAFLFYSKDWLEGTAELSIEAKGMYIDFLCYQHQRGDLPGDSKKLARLARLSIQEFEGVWSEIEDKFERMDNRLVNRKLSDVMTDRSEKGKRNKVIGTFAAVLRKADLDKRTYNAVRRQFKVEDFIEVDSERLTERLTEWCKERLKSIANANVNANVNIDKGEYEGEKIENYRKTYLQIKTNPKINIPDGFGEVIILWLKYKSEKNQSYKLTGLETLVKKLIVDTGGDPELAKIWVEHSMANNYSGIYPPKEGKRISTPPPPSIIEPDYDPNQELIEKARKLQQ